MENNLTPKSKCYGLHCRCMNLDKSCRNAHFKDGHVCSYDQKTTTTSTNEKVMCAHPKGECDGCFNLSSTTPHSTEGWRKIIYEEAPSSEVAAYIIKRLEPEIATELKIAREEGIKEEAIGCDKHVKRATEEGYKKGLKENFIRMDEWFAKEIMDGTNEATKEMRKAIGAEALATYRKELVEKIENIMQSGDTDGAKTANKYLGIVISFLHERRIKD